jgi:thioredoxin reductase (NADPH)
MINAPDILNYPGFENISGKELTERMIAQVKKRGGEIIIDSVVKIIAGPAAKSINNNGYFEVETQDGKKYQAKAIILATGTERRKLNVPGEAEYTAKGVYYCAACEKQDYAGKICAVVGGGNSAVQAAVELAQAAAKVYIIYRGSELRGDPIWLEQVKKNKKIEVIYNTIITEIVGDEEKLTGVRINTNNPITQSANNPIKAKIQELKLDKLFIEIGGVPGTALVAPLGVEMDKGGYLKVNEKLETNISGIFAAGDLVSLGMSIEQISSAVGCGARAATFVFAYLKQNKAPTLWGQSQIRRI